MPALPDVPSVLRNALKFTIGEDTQALIRFFLAYTGAAPTNTDLATFAAAVASSYLGRLSGLPTSDRVLTEVDVTDLTSSTAARGVATTSHAGTNGGASLPADVCALESREVLRRFRGGHGRIYWPFGSEAELHDAQTWKSTFVTNMEANLVSFYIDLVSAPWSGATLTQYVTPSYYHGFTVHTGVTGRARNVPTVRTTPLVDIVVSSVVKPGIASQRKRLLRLA
jgi:hypothetical protein